jgi:hypothetical protein
MGFNDSHRKTGEILVAGDGYAGFVDEKFPVDFRAGITGQCPSSG